MPRTVLLTQWPSDGRYAGGELIRGTLSCLPRERVRWAYLSSSRDGGQPGMPEGKAFPATRLHWRLRGGAMERVVCDWAGVRRRAAEIADWVRDFSPEVIWVLPELSAINVGYHLQQLLRVPMHATVFDAPETARQVCLPAWYMPSFRRSVRRLFRNVDSLDAVSSELVHHIRTTCGSPDLPAYVFPPSVPGAWRRSPSAPAGWGASEPRRIGFCGAFRVTAEQWAGFMGDLKSLPWRFEIFAFAAPDGVPTIPHGSNVSMVLKPYAPTAEIIRQFGEMNLSACYLGLPLDPRWDLFCRTSLSSKLATYAAAGLPVIADVPADSVAWRVIQKYKAGIRIDHGPEASDPRLRIRDRKREPTNPRAERENGESLRRLLGDKESWEVMAAGSRRMCGEEFDMERNTGRFVELLAETAEKRVNRRP